MDAPVSRHVHSRPLFRTLRMGAVLLLAHLAGCGLNPQPLPPGNGDPTGSNPSGTDLGAGAADAGAAFGSGDAGDGGDAGDAGDAAADASTLDGSTPDGGAETSTSPDGGDGG